MSHPVADLMPVLESILLELTGKDRVAFSHARRLYRDMLYRFTKRASISYDSPLLNTQNWLLSRFTHLTTVELTCPEPNHGLGGQQMDHLASILRGATHLAGLNLKLNFKDVSMHDGAAVQLAETLRTCTHLACLTELDVSRTVRDPRLLHIVEDTEFGAMISILGISHLSRLLSFNISRSGDDDIAYCMDTTLATWHVLKNAGHLQNLTYLGLAALDIGSIGIRMLRDAMVHGHLRKLRHLDLSHTAVPDVAAFCSGLRSPRLSSLQTLTLRRCNRLNSSDDLLIGLADLLYKSRHLRSLTYLDLSSLCIARVFFVTLMQALIGATYLTNLTKLKLNHYEPRMRTSVLAPLVRYGTHLTSLTELHLDNWIFDGQLGFALQHASHLSNLRALKMKHLDDFDDEGGLEAFKDVLRHAPHLARVSAEFA